MQLISEGAEKGNAETGNHACYRGWRRKVFCTVPFVIICLSGGSNLQHHHLQLQKQLCKCASILKLYDRANGCNGISHDQIIDTVRYVKELRAFEFSNCTINNDLIPQFQVSQSLCMMGCEHCWRCEWAL